MAAKKKTERQKTVKPKVRADKRIPSPKAGSKTQNLPFDVDTTSLCSICAKHLSLKRFVLNHGATGYECGICHHRDQIATAPADYPAISSLVRSLVRYFYDEWSYNPHWGGDLDPASLLCKENEIVEDATTSGFPRSAETSEGFLVELFHPPYPGYDKGVAVYGGFPQGWTARLILRACTGSSNYHAPFRGRRSALFCDPLTELRRWGCATTRCFC